MYIDTHAHLNFKTFNKDLDWVIHQATKAGISKIIIPSAKLDSSKRAIEIANKYPRCYAAIGIHPYHVESNDVVRQLNQLANNPKVVAIGEIGLDYLRIYRNQPITKAIKEKQKALFLSQLDLATILNLPIIIHCRKAYNDLLEILSFYQKINKKLPRGVVHCFAGDKKQLKKILDLEFLVGFDGNITYAENTHLKALVYATSLNRTLLETDSPYLTPEPFRGKRNQPTNLPLIAKTVAKIHQKSAVEIAKITTSNAKNLFNL